jgi:hypothetical protein
MTISATNVLSGAVAVFKIGGPSGTDIGATRGGVEVTRSLSLLLLEVDQAKSHLGARTIMNEMHVRTKFAEVIPSNMAYAWNIDGSTRINTSSMYVTDSDDLENILYFTGDGPGAKLTYFHAYRAFASGDMSLMFSRDEQMELAVDFQLLFDTTKTPNRFADIWQV